MGKEKFYYNKQTLRYEKVVEPLKVKALRGVGYTIGILTVSAIIATIMYRYYPSPREEALSREVQQMEVQYDALNDQIGLMSKVLDNVQDRDANVHRLMFGMDPIDESVWSGGVGGSEKYDYLTKFKNSGALLLATQEKADQLKRRLAIQSESLDKIQEEAKNKEIMLACMPAIKPVRGDKLKRNIKALSGFGMRMHPIHKIRKMHTGIDFSAPRGTHIQATGDGKVARVMHKKTGYGTYVVIDHGYGFKTLYGHMASVNVKTGQEVKRGQTIGTVGNTGTSTAPHLHYEVHLKDGKTNTYKKVNPIHYCMDGLSPEEYQVLADLASVSNQSFD